MSKRRLTNDEEEWLSKQYLKGESIRELSRKYNIDRRLIQHALLRNNIEIKGSKILQHIPIDLQEKIRDDLISLKYHGNELPKKYGVSRKVITNIVAKYNINQFKKQESSKKIDFPIKIINHVLETYGKTESLLSLSKIHGYSRSCIKRILTENNVKILTSAEETYHIKSRIKFLKSIENKIIQNYLTNQSVDKIKKEYHVSFETVRKILQENNIEIHDGGWHKKFKPSQEQISDIIKEYNKGAYIFELAEKYNVCHPTLRRILIENNVEIQGQAYSFISRRNQNHNHSTGISGYYKTFFFRSMNELSFIINYIEKKKLIAKSGEKTKGIDYIDKDGKWRKYFPDFYVSNGFLIEIKPKNLWKSPNVIQKAKFGSIHAVENNLKYRLVDYPVIIESILDKYNNDEIKFTNRGSERFHRIYKKYLVNQSSS